MISKEQFVTIINKMKLVDDFVNEVNDKARQLREFELSYLDADNNIINISFDD